MEFIKNFIKENAVDTTKEAINLKESLFFQENGDYDRSIKILDRVIKHNPKHAHAYYLRGQSKYFRGDHLVDGTDALADLEKAQELGSKSARSIIMEIKKIRQIDICEEIMEWIKMKRKEI